MPRHYTLPFRVGDQVYDVVDPRHVGQVVAVFGGLMIRVRWPNGWRSDLPARTLQREPK